MTKIVLCGACGKMGAAIAAAVDNRSDCEIVAGVDIAKKRRLRISGIQRFCRNIRSCRCSNRLF